MDAPFVRSHHIAASWLCFLTILLDGYDTAVISFTAPSLAHDWSLPAAAFTPAFVATSLGAVIGYLSCGALAARFGHRRLVIASVGFFGLMSLATVLATDITQLTALRFITALGLGGAIPTAIALASGHAEPARRERTASIVTVAIVIGSTLGGLVAVPILRRWGWQGPFVLGAILPFLAVPALVAWLPDTALRGGHGSPKALFATGLAVPTLLLWAMSLLSFMQSYSFTYWLPLLLTSFGFDRASAALGNTYIGAGGIAGVVLMAYAVPRVGSARYLAGAFIVGAGFVLLIAFGGLPNATLPALLVLTGAGLGIGGVGQAALGAMLYSAAARTTGVG
jgi:AAHS family 4-hydroxybenzoate transporter-like MFS transporter